MKASRFARLLPAVIALGATVLVLKSTDLVHEAYGQAAALTSNPVPANKDYAGGEDDQVASASEVDVVNSLARRRHELDQRENQLNMQANILAATESRVDAKIAQLKQLQAQISDLLTLRDQSQKDQMTALVKTYSAMKPKDAARIFNTLPDEVLVPVAQEMKSDVLSQILANMNSENAKALTVKLANKFALPLTTDALAPPAPPAPGPVTAALNPAAAPSAQALPAPAEQPVRKRVRKPAPVTETTASTAPAQAPVPQSAAAASAPAGTAPQAAPAAGAPQENQAQPKT
jgi:flagellar motility protein MotE (MotC chaperone)